MKLFEYAVLRNMWLWFHMMAGGFLAKAWMGGWLFFNPVPDFVAVRNVFMLAIAWELLEFLWLRVIRGNINSVYGSQRNFFMDAFGDIMGALFMAIIVAL